jgi:hypothetical protein
VTEHRSVDAAKLIVANLESGLRARRRHFTPALVLIVLALGGLMLMTGLRPDLLTQPSWQIALQVVLWPACMLLLPAIGVGLAFPARVTQIALAVGVGLVTLLATLGLPHPSMFDPAAHCDFAGGCMMMIGLHAAIVLGMVSFNGAFVQRQQLSAVLWIAAGVSLAALAAITWQCPETNPAHVVPSHLGTAMAVMFVAALVGVVIHRRRNRRVSP